MTADFNQLRTRLASFNQEHLLAAWGELDALPRERLADQITALDLPLMYRLFKEMSAGAAEVGTIDTTQLRPPTVLPLPETFEDWDRQEQAAEAGEAALRAGQVAVVLVAGGQGTRLGHPGPKGTYAIGPITDRTLFQIHAEKVLALSRRFKAPVQLYIMTSQENDAVTKSFFAEHGYFGLDPADVVFFTQAMMPVLDAATGRVLQSDRGQLALSPNGHGGVLQALADGGHLAALRRRGVRHLFYFQVDNPLVAIADPAFLGHHIQAGAEMSIKVVRKTDPYERIGMVVDQDGQLAVIEYSELPRAMAEARAAEGGLVFWAGSIAIHLFALSFLERLAEKGTMLPYHRAVKKVPYLNEAGAVVQPDKPNALKFEMFIFDAVPLAEKVLVMETDRRDEFEPLKNADGENSPATVRQALAELHARWLENAGVPVARRDDGVCAVPIEISPLFAHDAAELRAKYARRDKVTGPLCLGADHPIESAADDEPSRDEDDEE